MFDPTDATRKAMTQVINSVAGAREELEQAHGQVWNKEELQQDFTVLGFAAPFVIVQRKQDGVKGTLCFQHQPRFYFSFVKD